MADSLELKRHSQGSCLSSLPIFSGYVIECLAHKCSNNNNNVNKSKILKHLKTFLKHIDVSKNLNLEETLEILLRKFF